MAQLTRASLQEAAATLSAQDPKLGLWIERIGAVSLRRKRHHFGALCRSILSQQIAASAARTIHARFLELHGPAGRPDPERVLAWTDEELRACGISAPKVRYLRALAQEFHQGALRRVRFSTLEDAQVIERLTRVSGIGVWTAEMFLIFSLGRMDIFSVRDLALRNGVERVVGRPRTPAQIERRARRWAPYRSVASLYLWKIAHWKK